ncbi:MAG: dihydrofolate reductase family protein [Candidatus Kerfeldbacteria bacterium]|nr:dihydrofolate reductase family protein [Candidatus Kerfeldbacteria bacterium]
MKIVLVMVATADGVISKRIDQTVDWSSKEDKKIFIEETKKLGTIIMGSTTYRVIGRHLPGRLNVVLTSDPAKFANQTIPGELEFMCGTPQEIVGVLEKRGVTSAALIGGPTTNAAFLKAGLVNELLLSIEPRIFGMGINLSEGQDLDLRLKLLEHRLLNPDVVLLRYQIL